MKYRIADISDSQDIARIHVESWRSAYGNVLSPEYLAGDIDTERKVFWLNRLSGAGDSLKVVIAESDGTALGFACVRIDHDETWGSLLDNLHVSPAYKRQGIGRKLMTGVANLCKEHSTHSGLYLWVLEPNANAQKFYKALGASCTGSDFWHPPGGGSVEKLLYSWPNINFVQSF